MTSKLFSPLRLGGMTLPNRIAVAPMCQYSATDGVATDWHMMHLGSIAMSGAGLMVLEASAVEAIGRITPADLGIYDDACEAALARLLPAVRRWGTTPAIGIQLAHAGRKASAQRPWEGGGALRPDQHPWQTVAPSAVPFGPGWHTPEALDAAGLVRVREAFVAGARRAHRIGFDAIELHAAHGYLLHEFLSPISNRREDEYGGSPAKRMRFPIELAAAVRAVWPREKILGIRVSAVDWSDEGLSLDDTIAFLNELKGVGIDYVCVSSGGIASGIHVPFGPNYQVPFAARIKRETGIPTRAVGLIVEPHQAEEIVASGQADQVALARAFLDEPRWVWRAAEALGADLAYPPQYERSKPALWPGHALMKRGAAA
ncbi:MAG TPA: NADH:flavin oxidoreductase/NADH oxidase [Aliidongia sp.]|nr:NADH:flavin oxidoreductase/NADH oxidase [Aliidongia sp.]